MLIAARSSRDLLLPRLMASASSNRIRLPPYWTVKVSAGIALQAEHLALQKTVVFRVHDVERLIQGRQGFSNAQMQTGIAEQAKEVSSIRSCGAHGGQAFRMGVVPAATPCMDNAQPCMLEPITSRGESVPIGLHHGFLGQLTYFLRLAQPKRKLRVVRSCIAQL